MHDAAYKLQYSHRRMVADLLRGFLPDGAWPGFDFDTLEPLPASHVGRGLARREGDLMWRLRARSAPDGAWVHVLVLLEFQSGVDRRMALRVLTYTGLAWEGLLRRGNRSGDDAQPTTPLPPVIPFVVYNGSSPWTVPLDVSELVAPAALARLRAAFGQWVRRSWDEDYGVLTGEDEGLRRELARMAAAGEVEAMGSLAVEKWKERERQKEAQIFARGLEFVLERQAARRFGVDAGERLSVLLAGVSEPERLAAVGDAIIDCGTGAELLAAARRIVGAATLR